MFNEFTATTITDWISGTISYFSSTVLFSIQSLFFHFAFALLTLFVIGFFFYKIWGYFFAPLDLYINPRELDNIKHNDVLSHGSVEQISDYLGGFKRGYSREAFDRALVNKDRVTVKRMLPFMPDSYKSRFKSKIDSILK